MGVLLTVLFAAIVWGVISSAWDWGKGLGGFRPPYDD